MRSGPARVRRLGAHLGRAALPCLELFLALLVLDNKPASAQSLTPDLFNPTRGGFVAPQDLPLRPVGLTAAADTPATSDPDRDLRVRDPRDPNTPAPSRIGQIPT